MGSFAVVSFVFKTMWVLGSEFRSSGLVVSTFSLLSHFPSPRCRYILVFCLVWCCMTLIPALDLCQFKASQVYTLNFRPATAASPHSTLDRVSLYGPGYPETQSIYTRLSSNLEIFLPLSAPQVLGLM